MATELSNASAWSLFHLAECLSEAFSDYLVPAKFTSALVASMVRTNGIDLEASMVASADGRAVGCALIARRDDKTRLAGMGVVPSARSTGVGLSLVESMISAARARGDVEIVLEAFEENARALRLYERSGFKISRRLIGYSAVEPFGVAAEGCEQVPATEYARCAGLFEPRDLPWQLSAAASSFVGTPSNGFRFREGVALLSDPSQMRVGLKGLIVSPEARGQGIGTALLRDLFARFPDRTWVIPPIVPEGYAEPFLERVGFRRDQLAQVEMRLRLST